MSNIFLGDISNLQFKVGSGDCTIYLGDTKLYPQNQHDYSQDYFTIVATEDIRVKFNRTTSSNALQYSTDSGSTWSNLSRISYSPVFASGTKVLFKGSCTSYLSSGEYKGIGTFVVSGGTFNIEGNALSLLYSDNFVGQYSLNNNHWFVFRLLFSGCTNVISAENLSLPATTLADGCYYVMFQNCASLTTAPKLPATTLSKDCYNNMFFGCTSLTTAPSVLPATTLANYCYNGMFYGCTSLTTAPELPATTLERYCYANMFRGCISLSSIKCLATDITASGCTNNWVNGVASSGTFTKAASMSNWSSGSSGIPNGWTVQDYNE